MFSLSLLYHDYRNQTKEQLIELIEAEVSGYFGSGNLNAVREILKSIEISEDYTNNHHKEPQKRNADGVCVRASGEPYIHHPLRVMLILIHERLFDENVLKAAVMHDLYEDTAYTYENAVSDFNDEVADLIDCVTNVSEDEKHTLDAGITPEEIDYSVVIKKCDKHRTAFYIKFADRLDNLMTLDAMPVEKQLKKIEDTENYVLPLLKRFNANRFIRYFDNAIFKIKESVKPTGATDLYAAITDRLVQTQAFFSVEPTFAVIKNSLKKYFGEIQLVRPSNYEILNRLKEIKKNPQDINKIVRDWNQSDLLYDIYLIAADNAPIPSLNDILKEFTVDPLNKFAIEEVATDGFYFVDNIRNHYRVHLISSHDFVEQQHGNENVGLMIASPVNIYDAYVSRKMTVKTRDYKEVEIPVGSTVIDFAFYTDNNIGERMTDAVVNNRRATPYTKLNPGDTVYIICGTDPQPPEKLLNWIVYCETRTARRAIYKSVKAYIDEQNEKTHKPGDDN